MQCNLRTNNTIVHISDFTWGEVYVHSRFLFDTYRAVNKGILLKLLRKRKKKQGYFAAVFIFFIFLPAPLS